MSPVVSSRHFAVMRNLVAIGMKEGAKSGTFCNSFLRAFRQVHGYVPAESEGVGQNSD